MARPGHDVGGGNTTSPAVHEEQLDVLAVGHGGHFFSGKVRSLSR